MTENTHLVREEMIRFLPRLRSFAKHLTGGSQAADDLVQCACEKALLHIDQFKPGSRVDSWLYRIVYTQFIDHKRKTTRRAKTLINLNNHYNTLNSSERVIKDGKQSIKVDIKQALLMLSKEQRAAISLVTVAGYNYTEAAKILGLPVGTVASRVARGRKIMADYLSTPTFNRRQQKVKQQVAE